jgi:PAS domain S-box-containing protein
LNRFNPATETFKIFRYDPQEPNGINDDYIYCMNEDSRGFLWLGTSQGLTRFDRQKEMFHTYTERDGLPDRIIYAIVEDQQENLWVTTNRGLSRFNPGTGKFKNFDIYDGLQGYEFNTYSYGKGDDGELFFGGTHGFNSFYPEQLTDNAHIPPIVLTHFQLFNNDVSIGKKVGGRVVLNKSIGTADLISLSYKQNVFSFEFSALDYKKPEKNQYAYMMVGLDRDWNYVGNRRFASYTGIPPGKYTFRVKGSNNDGVWNKEGASLSITITPPFWQAWWFISLSALFIGSTTVGIVRMRILRLIHSKHALEQIVAERTQALVEANDYLENLFDNANAPIIVWDPQFRITRFNHAFETLTGRILAEILGKRLEILFPPEQSEASMELIRKKLSGKRGEVVEINIQHMDGSIRTVLWNSATLLSADGKIPLATISQIQDITGRKIAEEKIKKLLAEKELILQEVHHRIKNNMATMQGLFSLQADTLKNPEAVAALKDAGSRVQSMVVLYEKLYQSIGSGQLTARNYLSSLVDEIVANFPNSAQVKVEKKIADFVLNAKQLQPLGIIINELLTNIMKYAFADRSDGLIAISAELKGNHVSLVIQDNGIGMPETVDFENSSGFGLRLVSILTRQLAGTIRIEHGNGTKVILEF